MSLKAKLFFQNLESVKSDFNREPISIIISLLGLTVFVLRFTGKELALGILGAVIIIGDV